jgi:hypothetical protein
MSGTSRQSAGDRQFDDAVSSNGPQPPQGPSADKKHQLTVPNAVPRDEIHDHIIAALDSISSGTRVAVFDAAPTSEVSTVVVHAQPGTTKFILTQYDAEGMNKSETLCEKDAAGELADILGTRTREAVGEFYTKSSVGPGAGTLISQY